MAPRLNHPFLEGLKDIPEGKKKDLHKIKSWMNSQPHLPSISEEYIYLFLHACYYSHEKTKSAIENYFTIRANHPPIFGDRDPNSPRMKTVLDLGDPQGSTNFLRHSSNYNIHPEMLKQIIKEKDGRSLCNYYDSEDYKAKVAKLLEDQSRIINETPFQNMKESEVTYEHMINCAQPRRSPKVTVIKKKQEKEELAEHVCPKIAKNKRIHDLLRKKDEKEGQSFEESSLFVRPPEQKEMKENKKVSRKKYRKRTMILPLYFKKIRENVARRELLQQQSPKTSDNPAQKFTDKDEIDYENQLLNARKRVFVKKRQNEGYIAPDEDKRANFMNVEYEDHMLNINRFKTKSKYEGTEENRHWYQSYTPRKFNNDGKIKDINRKTE